ncbi:putative ring-h2 finger protein [Botrytis fragariae]|uniref:Putative ring-h2 finger protein n=1 Tax=Botrytis fragariae TaxID=1964551 RepID=A0A8H6AV61_9HELO|nr:putative ring-h2 finger protein [Botrytis fragariae]KAF5874182.1 putative ring-h2 finger protein [Botrytis fragariae]
MCITIDFTFSKCGHGAHFIRPCQEDGSFCGNMVTDPMVSTHADFCNDCFMLPDPRASKPDEDQLGYPSIDLMVELYQIRNVEDETKDLQVRLQNLPLPEGFRGPSYRLSNCRTLSLLPRDSLDVLFIMVNQRLIPDFWLRILRGELPSPLIRQLILHLRQIMMLNLALHRSRKTLSKVEWYIAMGYELFSQVESTSCDDDCGFVASRSTR